MNTVTHILGVRAFGTQLLCEQVVGRALRRQSYRLNDKNLFNVEYADIQGIPFNFAARPVVAPPTRPETLYRVQTIKDRSALRIAFPRVEGYRVELPEDRLTARFGTDSVLELTPDLVGATRTRNQGIIGEGVDLTLEHLGTVRRSTVLFHLAKHLLFRKFRDTGENPKLHLFGQLKRIAREWINTGYNQESFFVRHAYFLGANDPYKALKTTLRAEIDTEARASLNSDTSRPFPKPKSGRIAVKVINHLGDEVMKVFGVP